MGRSIFRWPSSKQQGHLSVFGHLQRHIHVRRKEIFSDHQCNCRTIATREQLLVETRLRLRQEESFFREQEDRSVVAFTLIELLVIIAILAVLAAALIPAVVRAKAKAGAVCCNCNLKQVGLSIRLFANDHGDNYPSQVSVTNGGSLEFAAGGNAFRHFQVLSNELSTPKVLVCPSDNRKSAARFASLSDSNLSYFISLDANESFPQMILSGDRHLRINGSVAQGLSALTENTAISWTKEIHRKSGSGQIGLADGSVQSLSNSGLQNQVTNQRVALNRLAIP